MIKIGIMQGRLSSPTDGKFQSFPKYSWEEEFHKAQKCGLKSIEWIYESDECEKNPISSEAGIHMIKHLSENTGVIIESICADYFMDIPYINANEGTKSHLQNKLRWLIDRAPLLGAKNIDLPFVDASSIGDAENFGQVIEFLTPCLEIAVKKDITIALETDLNPKNFNKLLNMIDHPNVMANYDTGNSSGIGYNCKEELEVYGKWISTVHIKDRLLNNGTMPLGKGSADFETFFIELKKLNYDGPIILQAAREENEEKTAMKNREFVEYHLNKNKIRFAD